MIKGIKASRSKLQIARMKAKKVHTDDEMKRAGIYMIANNRNGHKYIGQSVCLLDRKKSHLDQLKRGKHINSYLQSAYNYYGSQYFEFIVIEFCKPCNLAEREQYWIDFAHPEYNIVLDVLNISDRRIDISETMYHKDGESFNRPEWHKWVYGGDRNPAVRKN